MPRPFSSNSIRGRLLLLLLLVLSSVILVEAYIFYLRFEARKAEELQANLEVARAVAKNFEAFIQDLVHSELVVGLALTASQPITEQDRNRILDAFQADNPAVRSIFWMNDQGLVIASSLRSYIGFNLSDRSYFQKVKEGRNWVISELVIGRATGKPAFTVSRGIREEKGELLGVVAASIEPDRLDSVLGIGRSKDAGISVLDNRGMHVYRYPPTEYTWEQRNWLKLYPVIEHVLKGEEKTVFQLSKITGANRLVAFVPVSSIGWAAAASRGEGEVMKAAASTLLFQVGLVLLVTLVGFGAAVALARPISNSIIRLRNHAVALGRGETANPTPVSGCEEIKDLAVVFNKMAEEVQSRDAALRESEAKARDLIKFAPAAIYEMDINGTRFLSVNDAMCVLSGYTREELLAMDPQSLTDEAGRIAFRNRVSSALAGDKVPDAAEYKVKTKDGRQLVMVMQASRFTHRNGQPATVHVIAHDVTERKRADEALRESELKYRIVAENPYNWEFWINPEGKYSYVSPSCKRITGREAEEFIKNAGLTREIIFSEDLAIFDRHRQEEEEEEEEEEVLPTEIQYRIVHADGSIRWIGHTCKRILDEEGGSLGIRGTNRDITPRKQAEKAVAAAHQQLQSVIDNTPSMVYACDLEARFVMANATLAALLKTTPEQMLGKRRHEFMPQADADAHEADDRKVIAAGRPVEFEEYSDLHGRSITWLSTKFPLRDAQGRINAVAGIVTDISERKLAEEKIQRQVKELQAMNEELTRFNRAMVGREQRMIELKKQVNELAARLGEPAPYRVDSGNNSPS